MADPTTDVAKVPDDTLGALGRAPIIDQIPDAQVSILAARSGGRLSRAELNAGLELAVRYGLDPWANEIWFTKGEGKNGAPGKVLIMVGRDGLRKIAERNGLLVEGDVVRAKDTYEVEFCEPQPREWGGAVTGFHRVTHKRSGFTEQSRGPIVGAWCRVRDDRGTERGWFEAPLSEYKPANVSSYSPWSNQVSAMILGAAERQAIRQATPLGGLVHEGEADRNTDDNGNAVDATALEDLSPSVREVVGRARRLGHAGLSDADTVAMVVGGMADEARVAWVVDAMTELDAVETQRPQPVAVEGGGGTTVQVDANGEPAADVEPVDPDREAAEAWHDRHDDGHADDGLHPVPDGRFDEAESLRLDALAAEEEGQR